MTTRFAFFNGLAGRSLRLALLSSVGMAPLALPASAWAQTTTETPTSPSEATETAGTGQTASDAATSDGVTDIVVTARRTKEKLQEVPLVVTAITSDDLQKGGIRNLRDLAYLTPGLTIFSQGSETNIAPVIRGVVGLGGASGVSIFQDGINGGGSTTNLNMLDVERVEVVKGPVAAIYGGGAYSGAINYITKRPDLETITGVGQAQYGNSGLLLTGYVSAPIVKDVLAIGIAGVRDKFSDLFKDHVSGDETGGYLKKDIRANVLFKPADNFEMIGSFYYGKDSFSQSAIGLNANNCGTRVTSGVTAGDYTGFCGEVKSTHPQIRNAPEGSGVTGNSREVYYANLRIMYDLGPFSLNSLTSYAKNDSVRFNDFSGLRDGIPFLLTNGEVRNLRQYYGTLNNSKGLTQEFRAVSDPTKPLHGVFGLYYTKNYGTDTGGPTSIDGTSLPTGVTLATASLRQYLTSDASPSIYTITHTEGDSYAVFGNLDYQIVEGLTASGEYRHEWAKRNSFAYRSNAPSTGVFSADIKEETTAWRGSIKYQVMPQVMVFGSVGRGEKAGGTNTAATIAADALFGPERNTTYEVGLKSTLFDNHLQMNLSLFKVTSDGFQILGPASDPMNAALVTKNVGGADSKGVEFDALYVPARGVRFRLAASYTDPKFKGGTIDYSYGAFCRGVPSCASSQLVTTVTGTGAGAVTRYGVDVSGNQVPRTSKVTISAGPEFNGEFGDGWSWYARGDVRYESKVFVDDTNLSYWGSRFNTNLKAGVAIRNYQLSAFVNNVTNNKTPEGSLRITYLNDFNPRIAAYLPLPRTYGIVGEVRF